MSAKSSPRSSNIVSIDVSTPIGVPLSAFYIQSFAFYTTKNRWPSILQNINEQLEAMDKTILKQSAIAELDHARGEILNLIPKIKSNSPLEPFTTRAPDVPHWNNALVEAQKDDINVCFYNVPWLLAECYLYRRLRAIFEATLHLKKFDYFQMQKERSYRMALGAIISLGVQFLKTIEQKTDIKYNFEQLLKVNLWGNKCDLSLTLGFTDAPKDMLQLVNEYNDQILVDDIHSIWEILQQNTCYNKVIIVNDNAGYELFSDLIVADFMLTFHLAEAVHFYVKAIPWFISDVTENDFLWMLETLAKSDDQNLSTLGQRWKKYVVQQSWVIKVEMFWTLPYPFAAMLDKDSALYHKLSESKLIIFKGDLNYRKLVGDINWNTTTPFSKALQGFLPSNLCTLRTIKADVICGLLPGIAEQNSQRNPDWMISGDFAVVQYQGVTPK